jgi:hypothetical protein
MCLCVLLAWAPGPASATEITQLRVERGDDGVHLSALVRFDLPLVVEDALLKGIPMFFVVEADIYRDRWYWTDPRVASAARTIRLAYQPLTRRWRVNIASGLITSSSGLRATLNQNYETLSEACRPSSAWPAGRSRKPATWTLMPPTSWISVSGWTCPNCRGPSRSGWPASGTGIFPRRSRIG